MSKHDGLIIMVESEYFTIEMLLQYLVKYKGNFEVMRILVDRLNFYKRDDLFKYLTEFIFYSLYYNCNEMIQFYLNLASESFNFFFIISNCIEIWGHQFSAQNNTNKAKIRSILEECENKMVNGDRSIAHSTSLSDIDKHILVLNPEDLQKIVIGKRTKNDFKDEIRNFVTFLVRLSYMILNESQSQNVRQIAVDCLHKLNLELFKRRMNCEEVMLFNQREFQIHVQRNHVAFQKVQGKFNCLLTRLSEFCIMRSSYFRHDREFPFYFSSKRYPPRKVPKKNQNLKRISTICAVSTTY